MDGICRKYGIKSVSLTEYFPSFFADCQNHLIDWQEANEDVYGRIQTFLVLISKLKFRDFKCYCCVYPHISSSEYTVFVDIDSGNRCLLLTTIRDSCSYPKDARRIHMLKDGLLLLEAPMDGLLTLRQEMTCQRHPDGQFHR